jgi:hypothetical protein
MKRIMMMKSMTVRKKNITENCANRDRSGYNRIMLTNTDKKAESKAQYNAGHAAYPQAKGCPTGSHESFVLGYIDAAGEEAENNEPHPDAQFSALNYGQDY